MDYMDFEMIALLIAFLAFFGLLPALIAKRKGRSFLAWWSFGTVLFIIALPCALLVRSKQDQSNHNVPARSIVDAKISWGILPLTIGALLALGTLASGWSSPKDQYMDDVMHTLRLRACEQGQCGALEETREEELERATKHQWVYLVSGFLCIIGIGIYSNDRFKQKQMS